MAARQHSGGGGQRGNATQARAAAAAQSMATSAKYITKCACQRTYQARMRRPVIWQEITRHARSKSPPLAVATYPPPPLHVSTLIARASRPAGLPARALPATAKALGCRAQPSKQLRRRCDDDCNSGRQFCAAEQVTCVWPSVLLLKPMCDMDVMLLPRYGVPGVAGLAQLELSTAARDGCYCELFRPIRPLVALTVAAWLQLWATAVYRCAGPYFLNSKKQTHTHTHTHTHTKMAIVTPT